MIGLISIFVGSIISAIGALGLVRFPDIYSRTHAQTVMNVGGTCMILLGVFLESFPSLYSVKPPLLIIFIFLTFPVGSHAIARAAYKSGVKPRKLHEDELGYKIGEIGKPGTTDIPSPPSAPKQGPKAEPQYERAGKFGYKFKTRRFLRRKR